MELFAYPKYLYFELSTFLLLVIIYIQLLIRKENIIYSIYDENILKNIIPSNLYNLRRTRDILLFIALLFSIVASSGPQWGIEYKEKPIYMTNIAIIVDTSLSMSAKDIKPSRLESVKLAIKSLADTLYGYRVSLLAFQDKAYIQCPLTEDLDAIYYFTDILEPNMLPYSGTNIADSINTATEYLNIYSGEKIAVLFTDGEDHSKKVNEAIKNAINSKIKFITIGIGTPSGDILYDEETKSYKKDKEGRTVVSKLDEATLIEIAQKTEGKYIRYTTPEYVASEIKKFLEKGERQKGVKKTQSYKNRYQYFLVVALVLYLIEFIIMEGKNAFYLPLKAIFIILLPVLSLNINAQTIKSEIMAEKGNNYYKKNDFNKAKEYYEKAIEANPKNEEIKFNLANSQMKK